MEELFLDQLVLEAKDGSKSSKEVIIRKLHPLLVSSIKKYNNYREAYLDMYQDGIVEILLAIDSFDTSRKVPFIAYVQLKLRFMYLAKYDKVKIISLNEKINNEEGEAERLELLSCEDEDFEKIFKMEENLALYKAYEKLSFREKQIVDFYFINNISMVEIAKKLSLSYRTIVNTKERAIKRLRKNYKN